MHTKVVKLQNVAVFERLLEALAQELIESTDDELLQAAKDLGMDPTMRGSAAFLGLKYPSIRRRSDYFNVSALPRQQIASERSPTAHQRSKKRPTGRKKRRIPPSRGGEPK